MTLSPPIRSSLNVVVVALFASVIEPVELTLPSRILFTTFATFLGLSPNDESLL